VSSPGPSRAPGRRPVLHAPPDADRPPDRRFTDAWRTV